MLPSGGLSLCIFHSLICTSAIVSKIKNYEIGAIDYPTVLHGDGGLGVHMMPGAWDKDVIVIAFIVFEVGDRVGKHQCEVAVAVAVFLLLAFDHGCGNRIKISVSSNQKRYVRMGSKEIVNDRGKQFLQVPYFIDPSMSKHGNRENIHCKTSYQCYYKHKLLYLYCL